ncbi:hypothetical protein [Janthinobacterium lividum]|uniref:hypothetical protein n=1 Tax=Janthinobacterium lividum TaxID=29581 RepID=UPI0014819696|nr:hypothetical protein [Janthinobacterium lividum]
MMAGTGTGTGTVTARRDKNNTIVLLCGIVKHHPLQPLHRQVNKHQYTSKEET